MADDALTDAEREALLACLDNVCAAQVDEVLHEAACMKFRARAEGARDALNAAADEAMKFAVFADAAEWLRERAAQHEEQP